MVPEEKGSGETPVEIEEGAVMAPEEMAKDNSSHTILQHRFGKEIFMI